MQILDGKLTALNIKEDLKKKIQENLIAKGFNAPKLVVILIGDNPASQVYVAGKVKACEQVGVTSEVFKLPEQTSEEEVRNLIQKLNNDDDVNGILLQLPLPKHLDEQNLIDLIAPNKDVDGLTKTNLGKLVANDKTGLFGCTPSGIIELLKAYNIEISGKDVVIINRSLLVGKPLAFMFLNENATVTMCHSKTQNIKQKTKNADIVVVAVGKKHYLTKEMISEGAIVIDVGINRDLETKKIYGDVDFENVNELSSFITPVPGGVGPMTVAMLLKNTYKTTIANLK